MFEKKLKNTTRGVEDGKTKELASNPELIQILQGLNNNVMQLATILATVADSSNRNMIDVDSSKSGTEEPDQSSQAKRRRVQDKGESLPRRQGNKGSLVRVWTDYSSDSDDSDDSDDNMVMVTECGHLVCPHCIEEVCKEAKDAGVEALCPDCGEKIGVLRKVYL